MNGTERVQPSSWYYLPAAGLLVAGIAAAILLFVMGIRHIQSSMVRGEIPGQMDLELKTGETYTVFVEDPHGTQRGLGALTGSAHAISCSVVSIPAGNTLQTEQTPVALTYTYGARIGASILQFKVPHDGTYTLACADDRPSPEPKLEAAVGGKAAEAMGTVFLRSFVVLACGSVLGVLIGVRVTMLRLASRREIREHGLKPV